MAKESSTEVFQKLKVVCVPLLGSALLTPATIPKTLQLLTRIIDVLRELQASEHVLSESLINYVFFPVSAILQRNKSAEIPNQIVEKILLILDLICNDWWWTCDIKTWQQIFMLCGAIMGDMEGHESGQKRDDEAKQAAAQCLYTLLRVRDEKDERLHSYFAEPRLSLIKGYTRSPKFVPILGQTLNSLLTTTDAQSLQLQLACLKVIDAILSTYLPDAIFPSILPGVVSTATKLALNSGRKGWANGQLVAFSLAVLTQIVVKSIGDDVCIRDGAIQRIRDLSDIVHLVDDLSPSMSSGDSNIPYGTARTPSWLHGTSSQLHMALNALTSLVKHPTPSASISLAKMSRDVLLATPNTLPQSQTLLLSFLLSLSLSDFPSVSNEATTSLARLLQSESRDAFVQKLVLLTGDNLLALPRLLPLMADAKVEHVAGLIEAVCRLAYPDSIQSLNTVSSELGRLLGPMGGVEKWGWSLLSVLELDNPAVVVTSTSSALLVLEHDKDTAGDWPVFPEMLFRNVSLRSTYDALVNMFHALGRAAGDGCLFSVEWFAAAGRNGPRSGSVAAAWCACRLLEGCAGVDLMSKDEAALEARLHSQRLLKTARALAKGTAQLWDQPEVDTEPMEGGEPTTAEVQHLQGVNQVSATLNILQSTAMPSRQPKNQPIMHKAVLLQLLAVCAGILQARFSSLFIECLYPILHSLVSPVAYLSSTALASLGFVAISTSYASSANMLLSNFDYILNSVSRRLTRRWLDVDATKVLVIMIRLVGDGVVEKAGDVVEECFDRLDDYHGYEVLVEGLIEVLVEVTKVLKQEKEALGDSVPTRHRERPSEAFEAFLEWYDQRLQPSEEEDQEDFGPTAKEAWGKGKNAGSETQDPSPNADLETIPSTPTQALTKQIVLRSLYFLTHQSPIIRARILTLLSSSVVTLPGNAILPSVHTAWPFILNRLSDSEQFVTSAAAALVESLATNVGEFMYRRIWDDVWPRFKVLLGKLDASDASNALARRAGGVGLGTESAYTHSHRVYRSLLRTMTAALRGIDSKDTAVWEVIVAFRRFLRVQVHEELQLCARELYVAAGENNADAVWLALEATVNDGLGVKVRSLRQPKWDIQNNVDLIFRTLDAV